MKPPFALLLFAAMSAHGAEIMVCAAASLKDTLTLISRDYRVSTGDSVVLNLGASNVMARQIEAGVPADLFISADEATMDKLEEHGFLLAGTRKPLLGNAMVIVVPAGSDLAIEGPRDLVGPAVKRIALADPRSVPAGVYARRILEMAGVWEAVSPRVVPMAHVRAALAAVASGNVEAALLYRTDAAISSKVRTTYVFPGADSPAIRYPVAMLKDAPSPEAARKFLEHLESPEVGQIFRRFGFLLVEDP